MSLDGLSASATMYLDLAEAEIPGWVADLFTQEIGSLEGALGCSLMLGPVVAGEPRWVVMPRPAGTPVAVEWSPHDLELVSFADSARDLLDSTWLLARLARSAADRVEWTIPQTVNAAVDTLIDALGNDASYWQFADQDWPTVRDHALARQPTSWDEFREWAEELIAHLPDGHARINDPSCSGFHPPYRARLNGHRITLVAVPEGTAAHHAGVRPGWTIAVDDPDRWWRTTPASPQAKTWRAARRFLRVTGDQREFSATGPDGQTVTWLERRSDQLSRDVITVSMNGSAAVLVWLAWFSDDPRIGDVMDEVCRNATPEDHMVLDLRGNPGGKVLVGNRLARRFLRGRTLLWSTAYSDAHGGLAPRREHWADPSDEPRWPGRLTVLVDVHTFSEAEEFTNSLRGLPHVTVLGEVTGGGIGMPGSVQLGHGLEAWFATAIRYHRDGQAVDVRGIHPDGPLSQEAAAL